MNEESNWYQQPEMPAYRQFLILVGLFCTGLLAAIPISMIVVALVPNVHIKDLANSNIPYSLTVILLFIQDILLFALPAFLFAKIVACKKNYFQFNAQSPRELWLLVIVIAFAAIPVNDFFAQINEWIPIPKSWTVLFKSWENSYGSSVTAVLNFKNFGTFLFSLVLIALLPAVVEELFFRGALQQVMLKWTKKVFPAILITSVIFSAIHLSYYGFLARAALGMVLGYVYYYGKNIWLNILIHFINNATVVTALYIAYGSKPLPQNMMDDNSSVTPWYLQLIGLVILIVVLRIFIKKSQTVIHNS